MKFGVADYGMNVWYGGCFDLEKRLLELREIGYDGLERLSANSAADALQSAALFRKLGMDFGTCRGPDIQTSIQWTSGLGKHYVWTQVSGKDFDTFCRQINIQAAACARWGIKVALHNHLGSLVETQAELESFLRKCPECLLILDTAHLAAAGGDCVEIVRKYADRLMVVHLKDWLVTDPDVGLEKWPQRGRFCALGAGNIDLDNVAVMRKLAATGYDGWIFIEQDTHLQDPLIDLKLSREYLKKAGF